MKIAYYMPFKPLDHPTPSGDLIIGRGIYEELGKEQEVDVVSNLRLRFVYRQPLLAIKLILERRRVLRKLKLDKPSLWFSYHCYYKAPDLLGSYCSEKLKIPYVIFQGIYSTKRRKKLSTWLGFQLNKQALLAADLVITNKKRDYKNLSRLRDDIVFIPPGIEPDNFSHCDISRQEIRNEFGISAETTLIACAAMLRADVKTKGVKIVIDSFREVLKNNHDCKLMIIGNGVCRAELEKYGSDLGKQVIFVGRIERSNLYKYFSAADFFAFPGIKEALGMVYLEAQSCGLPVIAYSNWGASEAVLDGVTGLLSDVDDPVKFTENMQKLVSDKNLRVELGKAASKHIRENHDLDINYKQLNNLLARVCSEYGTAK